MTTTHLTYMLSFFNFMTLFVGGETALQYTHQLNNLLNKSLVSMFSNGLLGDGKYLRIIIYIIYISLTSLHVIFYI